MRRIIAMVAAMGLGAGVLATAAAGAQSFGLAKEKVMLERKLPALVHLPGTAFSVRVKATGSEVPGDLASDLQALLETELLKDDPALRADDSNPSTVMLCQITGYSHPPPTVTVRPALNLDRRNQPNQQFTRITGSLNVSFQARAADGRDLISDNVNAKYDEEFDSSGNSDTHGVVGSMTGTWRRIRGGESSEELNPPTDAELRSLLLQDAVQQIAEQVVTTDEAIAVYLARDKGALDDGDKEAQSGLWERALETFETAPPLPKADEDAYRLYNVGVAYEALAYGAGDAKTAMKYLDEAAINYGKAIDTKPAERYFLGSQKRIETAIAHYKELEEQERPKPAPRPAAVAAAAPVPSKPATTEAHPKPAGSRALTDAQVIAMVQSGIADDTVVETIRMARETHFDLSTAGKQQLANGGVSPRVLRAMQDRDARSREAPKPATAR